MAYTLYPGKLGAGAIVLESRYLYTSRCAVIRLPSFSFARLLHTRTHADNTAEQGGSLYREDAVADLGIMHATKSPCFCHVTSSLAFDRVAAVTFHPDAPLPPRRRARSRRSSKLSTAPEYRARNTQRVMSSSISESVVMRDARVHGNISDGATKCSAACRTGGKFGDGERNGVSASPRAKIFLRAKTRPGQLRTIDRIFRWVIVFFMGRKIRSHSLDIVSFVCTKETLVIIFDYYVYTRLPQCSINVIFRSYVQKGCSISEADTLALFVACP